MHAFGVNPRDADHRDLKLASGGARTRIVRKMAPLEELHCSVTPPCDDDANQSG